MLPLACYNDEQFYQETLPDALCCCLFLIFIPQKKVIITKSTREVLFLQTDWCHNCAWLPLRPYLYPNDVQEDCEVRNLPRRAADKWRKSGQEHHPSPGLRPPHPYIFVCLCKHIIDKKVSIVPTAIFIHNQQTHIRRKQTCRDGGSIGVYGPGV